MASFTDSKNREWVFPDFTEAHVIKIRSRFGVDFHLVFDGDKAELDKAFSNSMIAKLTLFMLEDEIEKSGLGIEGFAEGMDHATRVSATQALAETILSFSHGPEAAKAIAATIRPEMKIKTAAAIADLKKQYGDSLASSA